MEVLHGRGLLYLGLFFRLQFQFFLRVIRPTLESVEAGGMPDGRWRFGGVFGGIPAPIPYILRKGIPGWKSPTKGSH